MLLSNIMGCLLVWVTCFTNNIGQINKFLSQCFLLCRCKLGTDPFIFLQWFCWSHLLLAYEIYFCWIIFPAWTRTRPCWQIFMGKYPNIITHRKQVKQENTTNHNLPAVQHFLPTLSSTQHLKTAVLNMSTNAQLNSHNLDWLDLVTDPSYVWFTFGLFTQFFYWHQLQKFSTDLSFHANFYFWRDTNSQIPALAVTTATYTSENIGPEFMASAKLLCEVFHDDIATTVGKRKFLWDSVVVSHELANGHSCYTANC